MKASTPEKGGDQAPKGHRAALFPALSEGSKEKRAVSILLACMEQVPELAESLLRVQGVSFGKKSKLKAWTEVGAVGKKGAEKWTPIIGQGDKCPPPPLVRQLHAALGHEPLSAYTASGVLRPRP